MVILHFTKQVRSLYTPEQWDVQVALGKVREPPPSIEAPRSGIGCPRVDNITGRQCGAHLWDTIKTVEINGELRRRMYCQVCGFGGDRKDELHRSIADGK